MMPADHQYQSHVVFREIDRYIAFYDALADSVFPFVSLGTKSICNIDSYSFSSIRETLKSIQVILRAGRINDAYALLRKYYDSAIITIYSGLYLSDHFNVESFIVPQIDDWLSGKSSLPEYRVMSQYIKQSPKVALITEILFSDDRYKRLRNRCNDHTHYNFYSNVLLNDPEVHFAQRGSALDVFASDARDVIILHVGYLFFANQHYMASGDYRDSLECGLTPESRSEYWVAPFVQELFDEVIAANRPDLAAAIKYGTDMDLG